jgi:hypothetical protein
LSYRLSFSTQGFSDEHLKMVMTELDADGSGTIDLNEFEHLVRIANKAHAHKAEFGGQNAVGADGEQPAAATVESVEEQPVAESQSAPVLDTEQSTPAKKIAEAQALDANLNATEEAPPTSS